MVQLSLTHAYGAGSLRELAAAYDVALQHHDAELAGLCACIERRHRERYGAARLAAEFADEQERDAALVSDAALVRYERKWSQRLERLAKRYPARWCLPGLSDEELRDELTLRLVAALRTRSEALGRHQRAGCEWGLLFLARERRELSRGFRLKVVVCDAIRATERRPSHEERLMDEQAESHFSLARERAERTLSRPQRRWLAAMKMSANAGAFFESSGKLNLTAASRLLEKNRSSAQRAFLELRDHFTRELAKIER